MPPKDAAGQGPSGGGGRRRGLNDLPDNALTRVLRHLKAWEAVRTCLLSKRWCRLVDTAIPTTTRLDIRQPCYRNQDRTEAFAAFVKNLLLRRRRSPHVELDALRLCWSHLAHDGDANIWIAHAVRHGAEEIEFSGAHHAGLPCPDYLSFVPGDKTKDMRLKVVRLIQVRLDGTTLRKLCSSLEELELKDCSVEGKEIHSDKLKRLNMIGCRFVDGFSVNSPKLVSLRCIRPFGYVPRFKNMAALVTAAIMLDDPCLRNDRQWPHTEDQQDESGDEVDFFGHAGSEDSGCNSFAHSTAEESGDNNHNDPGDNSDYYDSDQSEPSEDKGGDRIICYSDIPIEHRKQTEYFINGKNSDFGGNDILCSLSNVETMDLLAHPEEMVLTRELKYCRNFRNLKTLSLGEWCMTLQFDALASILNHSPNLENLFLHLDLAFNSRVGINPQGSSFSCTNLKMVEIKCCNDDIMVHILAEFFAWNGIPNDSIWVCWPASSRYGSAKGDTVSLTKRKAVGEAEKRYAKMRKPGK